LTLIPAIGSKVQKLPLHRIDLGEICRDEVIAAALPQGQRFRGTNTRICRYPRGTR
jgi:hypothetical protein